MKKVKPAKWHDTKTPAYGVRDIDPRVFNVIYTLVVGSPCLVNSSGHDRINHLDLWAFEPGVSFFRWFLWGK